MDGDGAEDPVGGLPELSVAAVVDRAHVGLGGLDIPTQHVDIINIKSCIAEVISVIFASLVYVTDR